MRRVLVLGLTIAIALQVAVSLAADQVGSPSDQLKKSLQTWQARKAQCGGNYSYTVGFQSWAGFGNSTVIVVRNNKVVERKYSEFNRNAPPMPQQPGKEPPKAEGQNWTEKGKEIGTHKQGAPAKTLDTFYAEAKAILEVKLEPTQKLSIAFDKQGLLQHCFWMDTRIADDAPRNGVIIGQLQLEPADK